ncbi:hypothetical protein ALT721_2120005 [Alteromonas alvinellae]
MKSYLNLQWAKFSVENYVARDTTETADLYKGWPFLLINQFIATKE